MTSSADPASTPSEPEVSTSQLFEIWRTIGRLEGAANTLLEGQRELKEGQEQLKAVFLSGQQELRAEFLSGQQELRAEFLRGQQEARAEFLRGQQEARAEYQAGQQEMRAEFKVDLREVNRRIDRMFYTILGVGGALVVAMFASRFVGG